MHRILLAILFAAAVAGQAEAACVTRRSAEIPLRTAPSGWLVPLDVNRTDLPFLLDTGAGRSMIFADAAAKIGVRRDEWVATTTRGIGGEVRLRNADPDSLTLGGVALRRHTVAADNTLVVAPAQPGEAVGLLGQDLLSPYDVEIDGPRATLTLFTVTGCEARALPWAGAAIAIPAIRATGTVLLIPVEIDGHVLEAEIDTGATMSLVTAAGMRALGLTAQSLEADSMGTAMGVGPRALALRRHRFATVAIGGVVSRDVPLWVGPANTLRAIDMFLGRDWLAARTVWISFATNTVFIGK